MSERVNRTRAASPKVCFHRLRPVTAFETKTAMGHEGRSPPRRLSVRCRLEEETFAGIRGNGRDAPCAGRRGVRQRRGCRLRPFPGSSNEGADPKETLGTGSAGLAIGGAYLAVAAGVDHPADEVGVARQ